ncbi:MAG: hypothetical protein AAF985_22930, partial [Bacteroidota bacterium]
MIFNWKNLLELLPPHFPLSPDNPNFVHQFWLWLDDTLVEICENDGLAAKQCNYYDTAYRCISKDTIRRIKNKQIISAQGKSYTQLNVLFQWLLDKQISGKQKKEEDTKAEKTLSSKKSMASVIQRIEVQSQMALNSTYLNQGLMPANLLRIPRLIESKIITALQTCHSHSVLGVVGKAGSGKMDLLRNLYQYYQNQTSWKAWLIQAVDWQAFPWAKITLHLKQENQTQRLVLIDSVDVLLLEDSQKNQFFYDLFKLIKTGLHIVFTCRTEILSSTWNRELIPFQTFVLGDYHPEKELPLLIEKYIRYGPQEDKVATSDKVLHERLVHKLCKGSLKSMGTNPQLLKMILTQYRPEELLNRTMDISKIFDRFVRGQMVNHQFLKKINARSISLTNSLSLIALLCFTKGQKNLSILEANLWLNKVGLPEEHLYLLQQRRVIQVNSKEQLTFLSSSYLFILIARALSKYFTSQELLPYFKTRSLQHPFLLQVYQQYLTLLLIAYPDQYHQL